MFYEALVKENVAAEQARNLLADNPNEYAEIIKENFGMSYPEKFPRNFRDFILEIACPAGERFLRASWGKSRYHVCKGVGLHYFLDNYSEVRLLCYR